jgi:small nuclear ribonucleoprotein (snRNP)-like protein
MNYPRHRHHRRKQYDQPGRFQVPQEQEREESSVKESSYLKHLIDSRALVTVTMKTGEQFQGRIRYYDRDCFSVGLQSENKKLFLRKENVSYISEN